MMKKHRKFKIQQFSAVSIFDTPTSRVLTDFPQRRKGPTLPKHGQTNHHANTAVPLDMTPPRTMNEWMNEDPDNVNDAKRVFSVVLY
jgi:hypothetical protein